MPREDRPYSRVYHEITSDPKFETVYDDDRMLAWWLRLLIDAERAWPHPANLPAVPRSVRQNLEAAGIVDVIGQRYRIHGLDAERERRSSIRRVAADTRWQRERDARALHVQSKRTTGADARAVLERERVREQENQRVVPSSGFARAASLVASLVNRDFNPEAGYGTTLREDVADRGYDAVAAQLQATVHQNGRTYDCASLVYTAHKALYPIGPGPSTKDVKDAEERTRRERRDARDAARLKEYEAMISTRPE